MRVLPAVQCLRRDTCNANFFDQVACKFHWRTVKHTRVISHNKVGSLRNLVLQPAAIESGHHQLALCFIHRAKTFVVRIWKVERVRDRLLCGMMDREGHELMGTPYSCYQVGGPIDPPDLPTGSA